MAGTDIVDLAHDAHSEDEAKEETMNVIVHYHDAPQTIKAPLDATITDLAEAVAMQLSIPLQNQKFMIPKVGLLKQPFKDPSLQVHTFKSARITLMGPTSSELKELNDAKAIAARTITRPRNKNTAQAYKTHDWKKEQEEAQYTFVTLRPLPYLPKPEKSLELLKRLRDDPGIKASMRKHKWTVPLLTEMNPVEHTQADMSGVSRTLGLNRNRGEVIELRLRTDAYDGYRDYMTIRKTLCHEMAHNVWGDHDRNFWDLCHEIEKEVEAADWKHGGYKVTKEEFYQGTTTKGAFGIGEDEEEFDDHGGWTGGEFVLGAATGNERPGNEGPSPGQGGLSRREMLAKAAESRIKRMQSEGKDGDGPSKS